CPRCARRFAHRQHLLRHLRLHGDPAPGRGRLDGDGEGRGDSPAEEKPLPCPGCEMSLAWKQSPASHLRLHTGPMAGAGNGHLDGHRDGDRDVPAEEKLLACPQCGTSLTWRQNSASQLWQHLENRALGCAACAQDPQHPLQPPEEPGAQDPEHPSQVARAERPFMQDPQLLSQVPGANCSHSCAQDPQPLLQSPQVPGAQDPQHQPQVSSAKCGHGCAQVPPQPPQVPPTQRPFTCPQCGRGFGRKAHLARHLLVHSGTR
ncbi:ZN425 protein, partial [Eulacestoma nigropectus]|nr:ZN425 protein [Eulacestoma nigropectus]